MICVPLGSFREVSKESRQRTEIKLTGQLFRDQVCRRMAGSMWFDAEDTAVWEGSFQHLWVGKCQSAVTWCPTGWRPCENHAKVLALRSSPVFTERLELSCLWAPPESRVLETNFWFAFVPPYSSTLLSACRPSLSLYSQLKKLSRAYYPSLLASAVLLLSVLASCQSTRQYARACVSFYNYAPYQRLLWVIHT